MTEADTLDVDVVRGLLASPPPEFVAARNRVAKELRAGGQKEAAKVVAGMRRIGLPDWALNVVAGEDGAAVTQFADAADDVREAQAAAIEGRPGADVRAVLQELRERTANLVAKARAVLEREGQTSASASTGELTARLAEIAGNAKAAAQLRAGLLGAEDPGATDLFAGLVPTAKPSRRPAKEAAAERAKPAPRAARAGLDRDAAAARRARVRELAEAERRQAAAAKALAAADTTVQKAGAAVEKARARFEHAEAELAAAQESRDQADGARQEAADELAAAEQALDEAQAAVDADG